MTGKELIRHEIDKLTDRLIEQKQWLAQDALDIKKYREQIAAINSRIHAIHAYGREKSIEEYRAQIVRLRADLKRL